MTGNKRIALNVVATYGRSLYALVVGLFTARWALEALGQVDYGLYGVVGGLTAFISYFNTILGGAVGRFYAVSAGEQQKDALLGVEKCRMWFTTAVILNTAIPVLLIAVGYPLGAWMVERFLTIPPDFQNTKCVAPCPEDRVHFPFTGIFGIIPPQKNFLKGV